MVKKKKTTKEKKVYAKVITPKEALKPILEEEAKPKEEITLKNGICIVCNDPVTQEPARYDYPCHKECYNSMGDKKIQERIKELRNG